MGLSLALIVLGVLILLDRMGMNYGLKEGWPWVMVVLGIGGLYKNTRSIPSWITLIVGIFILGAKYYSLHIHIPGTVRLYFLPVLLIVMGLLWLWKFTKD